jgi:CTP:molybdopterin cytidylyltransferase MocA
MAIAVEVEQPRPAEVYRRLLEEHLAHGAAITLPSFEGTPGSPIVLGRTALAEARNLTDDVRGLAAIIDRHTGDIYEVPFDSDIVLLEIRSLEDYEHARAVVGLP